MKQRVLWIVIAAAIALTVLSWLLLYSGPVGQQQVDNQQVEPLETPTPAPEQRIILLFLADDGLLHPELRTVPLPLEVDERVRVVMTELLKGPSQNLYPLFPFPVELRGVFIDDERNAFVDLTPPPHPLTGSHTELSIAYGVVDSVLLNCPELGAVQLLFDGSEVQTLTGHLDLSSPLRLNKTFIFAL